MNSCPALILTSCIESNRDRVRLRRLRHFTEDGKHSDTHRAQGALNQFEFQDLSVGAERGGDINERVTDSSVIAGLS